MNTLRPVLDLIGDRVVFAYWRGFRLGYVAGLAWGVAAAWAFALAFGGWPWM